MRYNPSGPSATRYAAPIWPISLNNGIVDWEEVIGNREFVIGDSRLETGDWSSVPSLESLVSGMSSCPIAQSNPIDDFDSDGVVRVVPHKDGATLGTGEYASNALRADLCTKLKT